MSPIPPAAGPELEANGSDFVLANGSELAEDPNGSDLAEVPNGSAEAPPPPPAPFKKEKTSPSAFNGGLPLLLPPNKSVEVDPPPDTPENISLTS